VEGTRSCFSNNYTFDVHLADIFKPLSVGGTVVVARDIFRIPPVHVVSTLPNRVAQAKVPEALQCVIFTGEGITEASVRPIPNGTRVLNIFGATEFFDATLKEVDRATFPKRIQSIGPPLPDVNLYVVDPKSLLLQPVGEPGELIVGGFQVARGYMKRPELTAEKMFEAPWLMGKVNRRVYRTGDLVRRDPDGEFEYLGRAVHQVELRGHRFDLSTVESALCAIDGITEAAVVVKIGGDQDEPQLAAYVSPSSAKELVQLLAKSVPAYMMPNLVVGIDTWPRTSSGKIDRNRLPPPGVAVDGSPAEGEPQPSKNARQRWMFRDPASVDVDRAEDDDDDCLASPSALQPRGGASGGAPCITLQSLADEAPAARFPDSQLEDLEAFVRIQAYRRGVVVLNSPLPTPAEVPPLALLPSPTPRERVEELIALGPIFSRLVDAVACDVCWLYGRLEPLRSVDPWMDRLLGLMDEVYIAGGVGKDIRSEPRLLLLRQDYLPNFDGRYLQVEINTIAVAFAGLTDHVSRLHADALTSFCPGGPGAPLLDNEPGRDFARALANAHHLYCAGAPPGHTNASVCFLVFEGDHLEMDQQHTAAELEMLGVRSFRAHIRRHFELRPAGPGGALYVDGTEVSVIYFHCTYAPDQLKSEEDWANRRIIELSRAVKAPSLPTHLAGCKKVQEILSDTDQLRRFLPEHEALRAASVFARQLDPSSSANAAEVAKAIDCPEKWVLKPQREGGGNNRYGKELVETLRSASEAERAQYTLMEKITSTPYPALMMRGNGSAERKHAVSELGIFAALLAVGDQELLNTVGGAMLRTKDASSNEGGVCAGHGVIDTPLLLPQVTLTAACDQGVG